MLVGVVDGLWVGLIDILVDVDGLLDGCELGCLDGWLDEDGPLDGWLEG